MNPKEFAMEYLFPHLGIDNPAWSSDVGGVSNGSYGLSLTLRGMVKLGQLYLQNGKSDDLQVLSSDWIEKATSEQEIGLKEAERTIFLKEAVQIIGLM